MKKIARLLALCCALAIAACAEAPTSTPVQLTGYGQAKPVEYKFPGFEWKLNVMQKDWYERSFTKRYDLGDGTCLFKNFDVVGVIENMRGPCDYDQATMDKLQAGTAMLHFTLDIVNAQGQMEKGGTMDLACKKAVKSFEGTFWAEHGYICKIAKEMYSHGALVDSMYTANSAVFVVDMIRNGLYKLMCAFAVRNPWISVDAAKKQGYWPPGL